MIEVMAIAGNGGNAARWAQLPRPLTDDVVLTPAVADSAPSKPPKPMTTNSSAFPSPPALSPGTPGF